MSPQDVRIDYTKDQLLKYDSYLAPSKFIANCILNINDKTKGKIYVANPIVNFQEIKAKAKEEQEETNKHNQLWKQLELEFREW
mgnify:CR=1 FL=1